MAEREKAAREICAPPVHDLLDVADGAEQLAATLTMNIARGLRQAWEHPCVDKAAAKATALRTLRRVSLDIDDLIQAFEKVPT
jgi:hypothetical protein